MKLSVIHSDEDKIAEIDNMLLQKIYEIEKCRSNKSNNDNIKSYREEFFRDLLDSYVKHK